MKSSVMEDDLAVEVSIVDKDSKSYEDKAGFFSHLIFIVSNLIYILGSLLQLAPSWFLKELVSHFEGAKTIDLEWRWLFAVGCFVAPIVTSVLIAWSSRMLIKIGAQIRAALMGAIYQKALVLSSSSRQQVSSGKTVNVMGNDLTQIMYLMRIVNVLIGMPFQVVVAMLMIWNEMGEALIWAIAMIVLLSVMNKVRRGVMGIGDIRLNLINEILAGIRVIKFYCWENPFLKKIEDMRSREVSKLRCYYYLNTYIGGSMRHVIPWIMPVIVFISYSTKHDFISASTAFATISIFNTLRTTLQELPDGLTTLVQSQVSFSRVKEFLLNEDIDTSSIELTKGSDPTEPVFEAKDASFKWNHSAKTPSLSKLTYSIRPGQLVAVIGPVGSGKSSFISSLLGEMHKAEGLLQRRAGLSVSYCSQRTWLMNTSLRENVLYGKPMDRDRFNHVMDVCCLSKEMKDREEELIGDRGVTLSGGQKARVSLARAVYSGSDCVIMDDPLSAVDAHVGKALFNRCITGELKNKTRILVTNALQFVPRCDYVILLERGAIKCQGTYDEVASQVDLTGFIHANSDEQQKTQEEDKKKDARDNLKLTQPTKQGQKEERRFGSMPWKLYMSYFKSCRYISPLMIVILMSCARATEMLHDFWISDWTDQARKAQAIPGEPYRTTYFVNGLMIIVFGGVGLIYIRSVFLAEGRVSSARTTHHNLITSVFRAPVQFFNKTPLGQILNRFSRDMDVIDTQMSPALIGLVNSLLLIAACFVSICVSTHGLFTILLVPITIIYIKVMLYFQKTSTELQRLESISRTPIFVDFSEILVGASTIRAYGDQSRFVRKNQSSLDANTTAVVMFNMAAQWLSVRLDFLGAAIVGLIACFAVGTDGFIPAGWIAIAISVAQQIPPSLKQSVRQYAQSEANMNSVERINYYSYEIEQEPVNGNDEKIENWPSNGEIEFRDVRLRYESDTPLVLNGLSFKVSPREKIGVVGKTGAGKSTILNALFRLNPIEGGEILIDGRNLRDVGLTTLRSSISVIPQDPVLFSSSVRDNIDPFHQYSDQAVWESLAKVSMASKIERLDGKLNHMVCEGGENFSVGERQLICIARAVIRHPKILLMDEATASVDMETDIFIQSMIRQCFSDCTIIAIAHRLDTIMDSSRILVMDQGRVAEYDSPVNLMAIQDGIFASLVQDTGPGNAAYLVALAAGDAHFGDKGPVEMARTPLFVSPSASPVNVPQLENSRSEEKKD